MPKDTIPYQPARVGLRADGGALEGFGHLCRQLTLARALRARFNWSPVFLTATPQALAGLFAFPEEFEVTALPPGRSDGVAEAQAVARHGLGLLLCDVKTSLDAAFVTAARQGGGQVWLYGNTGMGRTVADCNVFAFPRVARELVADYDTLPRLDSHDNAILSEACVAARRHGHGPRPGRPLALFVSMGGADRDFLTGRVIRALLRLDRPIRLEVVAGPGFAHDRQLAALLAEAVFPWRVHRCPAHFAALAARCDLGLTQMGNTVAELNCLGVPVLTLNASAFHDRVAGLYGRDGALANLGLSEALSEEELSEALGRWIDDPAGRGQLVRAGRAAVDGRGVVRVARAMFEALQRDFTDVPCDVCGDDAFETLRVLNGRPLVRCATCGLEYMNIRPTGERLAQVYGAAYFTAPRTQGNASDYEADRENVLRFARARLDALERLLPEKGRLLDVGCALGFYLEEARTRGWRVSGMDISDYAVDYARDRLGLADVRQGMVETADYPPHSFDAIICSLVFEHFLDPRACLEKMTTWLRPGGYLAIKVPHGGGLMRRYLTERWFATHPDNHFCDYTRETLERFFLSEGLQPEHCLTEGIYLDRLTAALELSPAQRDLMAAIPDMEQTWTRVASSHFLGDSLVMYGRKL